MLYPGLVIFFSRYSHLNSSNKLKLLREKIIDYYNNSKYHATFFRLIFKRNKNSE